MQEDWHRPSTPSGSSDADRKLTSEGYFFGDEGMNFSDTGPVFARSGEEAAPGMQRAVSEMEFLAAFADSQPDGQTRRCSSDSDKPKATLIRICPPKFQQHDQQAAPFHQNQPASDKGLRERAAAKAGTSPEASHCEACGASDSLRLCAMGSRPPWNSPLQAKGVQGVHGGRLLSLPAMASLLPASPEASATERTMSLPERNDAEALASPRHWQLLSHEVLCEELDEDARSPKAAASPAQPTPHACPATNIARTRAGVQRSEDLSLLQGGRMLSLGPSTFSCEPQLSLTSSGLAECFAMTAGEAHVEAPAAGARGRESSPQPAGTAWGPSEVLPGAEKAPYHCDANMQSTQPFPEGCHPPTAASTDPQSDWQLETSSQGACLADGNCTCNKAGGGMEKQGAPSLQVGEASTPVAGPAATGCVPLRSPPEALSPSSQACIALHDDCLWPAPNPGEVDTEPNGRLQSFDSLSQFLLPEAMGNNETSGTTLLSGVNSWGSAHEGVCTCGATECAPWDDAHHHGMGDSMSILTSESGHCDEGCTSGIPGDDCDGVCQCEADDMAQEAQKIHQGHPCPEYAHLSADESKAAEDDICQCGQESDCDTFVTSLEVPQYGHGQWCTTSTAQSGGPQSGAGPMGAHGTESGHGDACLASKGCFSASGGVRSYSSCPSSPAFSSCTAADASSPGRLGMPPPSWPPQNLGVRNTNSTNLANHTVPVAAWPAQSHSAMNSGTEVTRVPDAPGVTNNGPSNAPPKLLQLPLPLPIVQVPGNNHPVGTTGTQPAPQLLTRTPSQQVGQQLPWSRPQEPLQTPAPAPASTQSPALRAPFAPLPAPVRINSGPSKPYKPGGWTAFLMEPLLLRNGIVSPALPPSALAVSLTTPPPLLGVPAPHHSPPGSSSARQNPGPPQSRSPGSPPLRVELQKWRAYTGNAGAAPGAGAGVGAGTPGTPLGGAPVSGLHSFPAPVVHHDSPPRPQDASAAHLQPQAQAPAQRWAQAGMQPQTHMRQQQPRAGAPAPAQEWVQAGPSPRVDTQQQRQAQVLGPAPAQVQSMVTPQVQAQGVAAFQMQAQHQALSWSQPASQLAYPTASGDHSGGTQHATGAYGAFSPAVIQPPTLGMPAVMGSGVAGRTDKDTCTGQTPVAGHEWQNVQEAQPVTEEMCSCHEEADMGMQAGPEAEAQRERERGGAEGELPAASAGARTRRSTDSGFRPRALFQERTNEGPTVAVQEATKRARAASQEDPSMKRSSIHDILDKGPRAMFQEYNASEGGMSAGGDMAQGGLTSSKRNRASRAASRRSGHRRRSLKSAKMGRKARARGAPKSDSESESESESSDEDYPMNSAHRVAGVVSGQDLDT